MLLNPFAGIKILHRFFLMYPFPFIFFAHRYPSTGPNTPSMSSRKERGQSADRYSNRHGCAQSPQYYINRFLLS
jgi:hypothetical protein